MAELDLGKLAAPLEALRSEIDAAYKRLDAKWDEISELLAKLPIPCQVSISIPEKKQPTTEKFRLEWRKHNGKRRICIVLPNQERTIRSFLQTSPTIIPLEEWGAEQKAEMLEHIPSLFAAATTQAQDFIDKSKL